MASTTAHPLPVDDPRPGPEELEDVADDGRGRRLATIVPVALSFAILAGIAALGMGAGAMLLDAVLRFLGSR